MRWKTVEQILKVISITEKGFRQGDGIDLSYQHAVNRVSQEYGIAYQTIGDACRRRLGLNDVGEFKAMLKATLEGDSTALQTVILQKTSRLYRDKINDFFLKLKTDGTVVEPKQLETSVPYTVQLRKSDSDVLKALSHLLGGEPEDILVKLSVEAVKERMKKAVNQL